MKKIFIHLVYLALLPYCKPNSDMAINEIPSQSDSAAKAFLALGDSYTIGEAVNGDERFPVQTVKMLAKENIDFNTPDIVAVTGWTTTDLIYALNLQKPKNSYDIVTLLIGVNNQYQHKNIDNYKTEFSELLNRAIFYTGNQRQHVFVLSIPDYSVTPFSANMDAARIAKEIDEFNGVNKYISENAGVHYVDITSISRKAKNDRTLVAGDGLHPSGLQYTLWSKLLTSEIKKIFR